jgi:hypothetical protein
MKEARDEAVRRGAGRRSARLVVGAAQVGHGGDGVEVMGPSWLLAVPVMTARLRGAVSDLTARAHAASVWLRLGCGLTVTCCYVLLPFAESFAVSCGGSLVGPWM